MLYYDEEQLKAIREYFKDMATSSIGEPTISADHL